MAATGFWTGMEGATRNMANVGLRGLQLIGQQRHLGVLEKDSAERLRLEGERLGIAKEADIRQGQIQDVQLQQANIGLKKAQEEEARLDTRTYKDSMPSLYPKMAGAPNTSGHFLENVPWKVDETGREFITERDKEFYKKRATSDLDFAKTVELKTIADYEFKRGEIVKQLNEIGEPPVDVETGTVNPEDEKYKKWAMGGKQLRDQIIELDQKHTAAVITIGKLDGTIAAREHAKDLKQMEIEAREPKTPVETWGDEEKGKGGTTIQRSSRGQVRTVYKPPVDPNAKESRVAYRDTATGAINYYDKNNPKDRETLRKYGAQLQPVMENPLSPVIREAVSPAPAAGKSAYKSADAVKAKYTATNKKGLTIFSDDGKTWKDVNGNPVK